MLEKFDITHFWLICNPNQVFFGNKTKFVSIQFHHKYGFSSLSRFYEKAFFVKIVKVKKTHKNVFEFSHKTPLVLKIGTD